MLQPTKLANPIRQAIDPELIVWMPIPGSSQELAVDTRCDHTLYHGTRGPGKTITQLMRFRRRVGIGYGSHWRGVIFDREFKNLGDLVAQSKRFFEAFGDGAVFLKSAQEFKWVWPTGEELLFRHVKVIGDYDGFHGHEYPFIGWNELTKHPTADLYNKMMSTNRSSFVPELHTPRLKNGSGKTVVIDGVIQYDTPNRKPLPNIPLEVFSTTNPSGPGHNWVKRMFINVAPDGVVVKRDFPVFDPKTQEDIVVTKSQVAIFGSYRENTYLDAKYIAELNRLTESDPNLREAWLKGNWDVTAGGALDDLWKRNVHTLPRFVVPKGWRIDRSFDWGSSHPFSVGWWAEANGEEADIIYGGQSYTFCPPRGTLVQLFEWYGTEDIGTNKGLKMSAGDIAQGIIDREISLMANGWIQTQPYAGPADNSIDDVKESDVDTILTKMQAKGVSWIRSDKSDGARRNGLQLIRDRLLAATRGEGPALYFMQNCEGSIETLPSLPRDEIKIDDVDTDAEDHAYDMVRYRVLRSDNGKPVTNFRVRTPT